MIPGFGQCSPVLALSSPLNPVAADFSDSIQNTAVTVGAISTVRPNCLAPLRLTTPAGCYGLQISVTSNLYGLTTASMAASVFVDGVFSRAVWVTTRTGSNAMLVPLDGDAHTVEIISPYQEYDPGSVGTILGSFIYDVRGLGAAPTVAVATASKRAVVYGDSIASGALAVPASEFGWLPRLRVAWDGRIALEAWGGRALYDDSGNAGGYGFASYTLLAQRLVALCFAAGTRVIYDAIGINDWGGRNLWSAANFGTGCAAFYDAIHVADPAIQVIAQTPLITGVEGSTNSFGDLPAAYRTAKATATSGRAWVTLVDGTTLVTAGGIGADNIHPTTAGHATLATNILGLLP